MKKYLVRSIGWVFDDDWYNYDGEHDIEGFYDSKDEAIKRVDYLNHRHFLARIFISRPYQLTYNYSLRGEEFMDKNLLAELIAQKIEVEKEEIYNPKKGFIWRNEVEYLNKLSEKQVKEILKALKMTFFKLFEFNAEGEISLYQFKRNPDLWNRFVENSDYSNPDDYYIFFDDRDADKVRLVSTIRECYYYAINQHYDSITWGLTSEHLICGALKELSYTPELLTQIIKNSTNIKYDPENKLVIFSKDITSEEIMSLDSVLIKPILLIEKVHIDSLPIQQELNSYIYNEIKRKYNI